MTGVIRARSPSSRRRVVRADRWTGFADEPRSGEPGRACSGLSYHSFGAPTSGDCRAAAAIAEELDLEHHRRMWPMPPGGHSLDTFVSHVRNSAGQSNCWESSVPMLTEGISISGLAGESLRTNYPRFSGLTTERRHSTGSIGSASVVVTTSDPRSPSGSVTGPRRCSRLPSSTGARPADLFDIFYVQHRLRRWVGDRPDRFHRYVFPLYSPPITRAILALGWQARADAMVHTEIRRRAALPSTTSSSPRVPAGTASRRGWPAGARASCTGSGTRSGSARTGCDSCGGSPLRSCDPAAARRDAVFAAVDHDPANPAFEVVDKAVLLADAARFSELDRRQRVELHAALTFVLWLGLAGRLTEIG